MRFDARRAKLLNAGDHLTLDDFPGLRLEASATRRSWTYRYKSPVDSRMRQIKLGEWPTMALSAAIVEWERVRAIRESGADPALAKKQARTAAPTQPGEYTVKQLCADYLAGHVERHRKSKGAADIRRTFATKLGPIADLPAHAIDRRQAFDLLEAMKDAPTQAAKLRSELGAAWDYALDAGRLPDDVPNWWRQIMRNRLKTQGRSIRGIKRLAKRTLGGEEIRELVQWMPNFSETVGDALTLYLWTGTRGAEIVAMEGKEITEETDGTWWTIPKAKTKNSRHPHATDLRVPLVGRALDVIARRRDRHGRNFLFPGQTSKHIEQGVIQTAVYKVQPYSDWQPKGERISLPVTHWAPHDLRRTVRTMLAAMGCPNDVAEAVLGHMQPGIAGVYNQHRYDSERRHWLTLLSARLEELVAG